ncbi:Reverse transcriptase (RNA-dependent DNA polymerase) (plasmid) [Picosynechococcus sp. PCC 7002]|nr:Reverse transcriptase (RNA-dependent DNA polymerase) [Picosynechococcus sp. PCC 7002]
MQTPQNVAVLLDVEYDKLIYHIYSSNVDERYKKFEVYKKSGGIRTITTPVTSLKFIQWKLNQVLNAVYQPKPAVHGFTLNKNILTNAQAHVGKRFVLNLDLEDFFPSINFGRVRGLFMAPPYQLPAGVATVLAQICCYDNQLPQGAPTSPIVSNMICAKMDTQLQRLAKECRATYTRYADDITFSTTLREFPEDLAYPVKTEEGTQFVLGDHLLQIIAENGFKINNQKTRLQTKGSHQEVTGLTVNQFPNVKRTYVRQIRAMLYAWEKFGLQQASQEYYFFYKDYNRLPLKFNNKSSEDDFVQVIKGKIEYLGMIRGKQDSIYRKYISKFNYLKNYNGR